MPLAKTSAIHVMTKVSFLVAIANACGHPYNLQIRSHVSKSGERELASKDRYSEGLMPSLHATCPTAKP
jgi:hypothetical protein